jgi:hypothetical protein
MVRYFRNRYDNSVYAVSIGMRGSVQVGRGENQKEARELMNSTPLGAETTTCRQAIKWYKEYASSKISSMDIFDDIDTAPRAPRGRERPKCLDRESVVQREILAGLFELKGKGVFAFRQNVVAAKIDDRFIASGMPGQADISACVRRSGGIGQRVEIECKRRKGGIQFEEQKKFQAHIEAAGGLYVLARDCKQVISQIKQLIDN